MEVITMNTERESRLAAMQRHPALRLIHRNDVPSWATLVLDVKVEPIGGLTWTSEDDKEGGLLAGPSWRDA